MSWRRRERERAVARRTAATTPRERQRNCQREAQAFYAQNAISMTRRNMPLRAPPAGAEHLLARPRCRDEVAKERQSRGATAVGPTRRIRLPRHAPSPQNPSLDGRQRRGPVRTNQQKLRPTGGTRIRPPRAQRCYRRSAVPAAIRYQRPVRPTSLPARHTHHRAT